MASDDDVCAALDAGLAAVEALTQQGVGDRANEVLSLLQKLGSLAVPILMHPPVVEDPPPVVSEEWKQEEVSSDDSSETSSDTDDEGLTVELLGSLDNATIEAIQAVQDEPTVTVVEYDRDVREFLAGGFHKYRALAKEKDDDDSSSSSSDEEEEVKPVATRRGHPPQRPPKRMARASLTTMDPTAFTKFRSPVILRDFTEDTFDGFLDLYDEDRIVKVQHDRRTIYATAGAFGEWLSHPDDKKLMVVDSLVGSLAGRLVERAFAALQTKCGLRSHLKRRGTLDLRWAGPNYDEHVENDAPATLAVLTGSLKADDYLLSRGDALYLPAGTSVHLKAEASPNVLWTRRFWM